MVARGNDSLIRCWHGAPRRPHGRRAGSMAAGPTAASTRWRVVEFSHKNARSDASASQATDAISSSGSVGAYRAVFTAGSNAFTRVAASSPSASPGLPGGVVDGHGPGDPGAVRPEVSRPSRQAPTTRAVVGPGGRGAGDGAP